jgi:hypothetical protein
MSKENWKDTSCILGNNVRWWYEKEFGKLPTDVHVLHYCDNPQCRNTDHIFLGSKSDNMQDMISKGRNVGMKGQKLSEETKLAISIARTGTHLSEETKEKVSEARKGMKFSEEHKNNISLSHNTPEYRKRFSESRVSWWQKYVKEKL